MGQSVTVDDAEKLDTYTVDDRGRVTLGKDYSGEEVQVAFTVINDEEN